MEVKLKHIDVRVLDATDLLFDIRMYRRGLHCDARIEREAPPESWRHLLSTMIEQLNIAENRRAV
jgi:hypothetical protein